MAQLSIDDGQAQSLLDAGHISPETYQMIQANRAPADAPAPAEPKFDEFGNMVDTLNPFHIDPAKADALHASAMNSLPTSPDDPKLGGGKIGMGQGVQASLDPTAGISNLPSASSSPTKTEAGHVDLSNLATPAVKPTIDPTTDPMARAKAIDSALGTQSQAVADEGKAGANRAIHEAAYLDQAQKEIKARQIRDEQMRAEEDKIVSGQMAKVQATQDEITKQGAADPNRLWHDMSTGNKITAGISIALGALGGALTGHGGNAALDVINKAIERDFDAQKLQLEQKQRGLSNQMNIVGMYRQQFSDRRSADAAAMADMYNRAKLKLQQISAQYSAPEIQARAKQLGAGLDAKRNELMMTVEKSVRQQAAETQLQRGAGTVNVELLPKDVRERVVNVDGKQMLARSDDDRKEATEVLTAASDVKKTLADMRALQAEVGRGLPYTDAKAKAAQLQAMLLPQLNHLAQLQRLTEQEIELYHQQIPDPTSFRQGKANTLLEGLEKLVGDKVDSTLSQRIPGYQAQRVRFTPSR